VLNGSIALGALVGALAVPQAAGQAAGQAPKDQPAVPSQATVTVKPVVTLTGCLYREDQVPGRTPNVAERAGILEDYILADATMADAQQGKPSSGAPTGTSGLTPATGSTYKVENLPDERLKALLGKRVEVTGRIDPEGRNRLGVGGGPKPDRGPGPDALSLPEVEASSIREVPGTCPAKAPLPR
jgi:hypothetical protein